MKRNSDSRAVAPLERSAGLSGAGTAEIGALRPNEFEQIRTLARRASGLDLQPGKEELVSARLRRLVRAGGHQSFRDYYDAVRADATGKALASMIDALTTNHTSFLRESGHFEFLRRHVLSKWPRNRPLDIWSAGCATGEEVWTIAFLVNDALPGQFLRITATDISMHALAFAERAIYPAARCEGIPRKWLLRYLTAIGDDSYRVVQSVREQAAFTRLNLIEPLPWRRLFPAIFCRNVMIYFDRSTQERVVQALADRLEPGGYLFVGHSEGLTRVKHSLEYVRPAVYRKPDSDARMRKCPQP